MIGSGGDHKKPLSSSWRDCERKNQLRDWWKVTDEAKTRVMVENKEGVGLASGFRVLLDCFPRQMQGPTPLPLTQSPRV